MDARAFREWTWQVADSDKPALSQRVTDRRAETDAQYLGEARAAAEAATEGTDLGHWLSVGASASPEDWLDRSPKDLQKWNLEVADLRDAYRDTLLALAAGDAIGKGHGEALAEPLLPEVPGLAEALGIS